jgi:hypothetical protein
MQLWFLPEAYLRRSRMVSILSDIALFLDKSPTAAEPHGFYQL